LNDEEIVQAIEDMENSSKALKHEVLQLCWYMRGGISYEDAMWLSSDERKIISDIVKGNMETTKKSGLPFF
jgi:exonuclease VII large subunit